jgi:hypothetical protein
VPTVAACIGAPRACTFPKNGTLFFNRFCCTAPQLVILICSSTIEGCGALLKCLLIVCPSFRCLPVCPRWRSCRGGGHASPRPPRRSLLPQRQLPCSRRSLTLHLSALPTPSPGHFAAGDSPDLHGSFSLVLRCRNGRDVEYMRVVWC